MVTRFACLHWPSMIVLTAHHVEEMSNLVVPLSGLVIGWVAVETARMRQHTHYGIERF